jgi:hypothetical protein
MKAEGKAIGIQRQSSSKKLGMSLRQSTLKLNLLGDPGAQSGGEGKESKMRSEKAGLETV